MIAPFEASNLVVPVDLSVSGRSPTNDRKLSPLRTAPRASDRSARRLTVAAVSPRDRSGGLAATLLHPIFPRAASPRNYAADIRQMTRASVFPDCAQGTIYSPVCLQLPRLPTRASQSPTARDRPPTRHISCPMRLQGLEEEETLRRLSTVSNP